MKAKPGSSRLKTEIVERVAQEMKTTPAIVEAVVTHQFKGLVRALTSKNIGSVEMSGFGKWLFLTSKAKKMKQVFEDELARRKTGEEPKIPKMTVETLEFEIAHITNQLEYVRKAAETNSRRVGKRDSEKSPSGGDSRQKAGDLRGMPEPLQEQEDNNILY